MEETKEHIKQLIDYFTGNYLACRVKLISKEVDSSSIESEALSCETSHAKVAESSSGPSRNDINLIIKTLELW